MIAHESSVKDTLALGLSWLAFLLSLALIFAAFASGALPRDFFYDSDALNLPSMYRDLFREHGSFFDWQFSASPFFFPDMPLYFLINFLIPNFHLAIVFYGVAQNVLFMLGLMLLGNQLLGRRPIVHCMILLSGTLFFIHLANGIPASADIHIEALRMPFGIRWGNDIPVPAYVELCLPMLKSIEHGSVPVVGVYVLSLLVKGLDHDFKRRRRHGLLLLAGILIPSILMAASDMLFVVQVMIPAVLAMAFLFLIARVSLARLAGFSLAFLLAVLLGRQIDKTLVHVGVIARMSYPLPGKAARTIAQWAWETCKAHWVMAIIWVVFMAISLATPVVAVYRASRQKPTNRNHVFFFTFILSLVTVNFAVVTASGLHQPRYFIPAYLMPAFFGWPMLLGSRRRLVELLDRFCVQHVVAGGLALFLATLLCVSPTRNFKSLAAWNDYYPDAIRRLDEYARQKNLKNGVSEYWPAKRVSMLSKAGLRVSQVDQKLHPHLWISSRAWYNRSFDFVLLENLREPWIIERFGQPRDELKMNGNPVACVYDSTEFRNLFKGNEVNADFSKPNAEFEFYPAQIGGEINNQFEYYPPQTEGEVGECMGFSRGGGFKPTPKGCLLAGPHVFWLPTGNYHYAIRASASGNAGKPVGSWTVLASRARTRLGQGVIAVGDVGAHEGRFSLDKPTSIEFQVDYNGSGALRVDGIHLKRE
jgi:hypothetical protein